jgi:ribose transport system permease protein
MVALVASAGRLARTARSASRPVDLRRHGVYLALAVMFGFNLAFTPNFATLNNLRLQLVQVTPVVIVAVGMVVVIATAGIDLSVGSTMALAAATLAALLDQGPWIAMGVAVLAGAAAGLVNGWSACCASNRSAPRSACSSPGGAWR